MRNEKFVSSNENFYSVHTDINYTNKGCMTCEEKQEMPIPQVLGVYSLVVHKKCGDLSSVRVSV